MATVKVYRATQRAVDMIKGHLRKADLVECAALGIDADSALQESFKRSDMCYVQCLDMRPIVCAGVAPVGLLSDTGRPWMLGTDDIRLISRQVVRRSREIVLRFLDRFDYLENYVHVDNETSKAWLKWCGFTIEKPEVYGIHGELFHRFWMRRGKLCA